MALVHHLFLCLLILVLHPGAANYTSEKSQVAAESLADSMAAWKKDGLEPLGEPEELLPKSGEKWNKEAGESPQADPKHSETAGEKTKEAPKAQEHIETLFCHGAGCMIGLVIVLIAMPVGILICSLAIYWWCERKRRSSGDHQEGTSLITCSDSRTSSPEPALPLQ